MKLATNLAICRTNLVQPGLTMAPTTLASVVCRDLLVTSIRKSVQNVLLGPTPAKMVLLVAQTVAWANSKAQKVLANVKNAH